MHVLITGGAGFIGSHCVDRFLRDGAEVAVLDNLDPQVHQGTEGTPARLARHLSGGRLRFVRGDVRDRNSVVKALDGVDTVVHLAASVGIGLSMYRPHSFMDVNVAGQAMLMEEMAKEPGRWRRFVVASSNTIYGEGMYHCGQHGAVEPPPRSAERLEKGDFEVYCPQCAQKLDPMLTPEEKALQAPSVYAISKKTQEESAICFGRAFGIPTVALRFFNVYGSRQALSNPYTGVLVNFVTRLKNGNPPIVFEDGLQSRDFVHVSDVAEAVWLTANHSNPSGHVYNICTGRPLTIRQVADVLRRLLGAEIEPQTVWKYRVGDVRHCVGDPAKAERGLGFRARCLLEDGVKELLYWAERERAEDRLESSLAELERLRLIR